jgi:hypothetical protein
MQAPLFAGKLQRAAIIQREPHPGRRTHNPDKLWPPVAFRIKMRTQRRPDQSERPNPDKSARRIHLPGGTAASEVEPADSPRGKPAHYRALLPGLSKQRIEPMLAPGFHQPQSVAPAHIDRIRLRYLRCQVTCLAGALPYQTRYIANTPKLLSILIFEALPVFFRVATGSWQKQYARSGLARKSDNQLIEDRGGRGKLGPAKLPSPQGYDTSYRAASQKYTRLP